MNISVKSEYALKAVFDLSFSNDVPEKRWEQHCRPVKIADIARRQKIPQKFLELILAGLKQSGFVDSRRGAEGGYLLARAPDGDHCGRGTASGGNHEKRVARPSRTIHLPISGTASISQFPKYWTRRHLANWRANGSTSSSQYVPNWDI